MQKIPSKIMLLDDDTNYLEFANDLLTQAGFSVYAFSKPSEGWEELEKIRPHCLVLDLHMPFFDGREFLPWARKACPNMTIVICTGQEILDKKFFQSQGVFAILQKPVASEDMIRTLRAALKAQKA